MWHLRQKWANLLQLILLLSPSDHFGSSSSAEKEVWQVMQATKIGFCRTVDYFFFKSHYSQKEGTVTFHIYTFTHFFNR